MADRPVPQPITVADEYLAAIHDRLGEILDRLPERPKQYRARPDGAVVPVELTEPKRPGGTRSTGGGGGKRAQAEATAPRPAQRRKPAPKNT